MIIGSIVAMISLLIVASMAVFALSRKGRVVASVEKETPFVLEGDVSQDAALSSSDPGPKVPRAGAGTTRETLEGELRERAASGKCLICPEKATHAMPRRLRIRRGASSSATWNTTRVSARRTTTSPARLSNARARR